MSVEHASHDLAHQYDDLPQQHSAGTLGMWLFLATEVLFFGGLFATYTVLRYRFFDAFIVGSEHLNLTLGTINTVVLLTSSLTMAFGVHAAQKGKNRALLMWLSLTLLLGAAFLGVKAVEWAQDYRLRLIPGVNWNAEEAVHGHPDVNANEVKLFFITYFCMTGLHALHMLIGFGILGFLMVQANRGRYSANYYTPVEVSGLYWHFVDVVWIFLFPLLYLIRH